MKKVVFLLVGFVFFFTMELATKAQIEIVTAPFTYEENFDSLGTNSFVNWFNTDLEAAGWFFINIDIDQNNQISLFDVNLLTANPGNQINPFPYHFGSPNQPDRSLGAQAGPFGLSNQEYFFGASFVNLTLITLTNVTLSCTLEQWNDNDLVPQSLQFFYNIGATNFAGKPANEGWTAVPHPGFTSPRAIQSGSLDGNAVANQNIISVNFPITLNPNEILYLAWYYPSDRIHQHPALGIDDLHITFTGNNTENPIGNDELSVELIRPHNDQTLQFRSAKGFKVKGRVSSEDQNIKIDKISYCAYEGTNFPSNFIFTAFSKFKPLSKGELYRQGYRAIFGTKPRAPRPGIGLKNSFSPINLLFKVDYSKNTNSNTHYFIDKYENVEVRQ